MAYFQVRKPYRTSRSGINRKRSAAPRTNGSRVIRRRTTGRGRGMPRTPARPTRPAGRRTGGGGGMNRSRRTGGRY